MGDDPHAPDNPSDPHGLDGSDAEYPVGGPDPDVEWPPADVEEDLRREPEPPPDERFQFTMAELFGLMLQVALVLGILGLFPAKVAAWLAGMVTLGFLIMFGVTRPNRPIAVVAGLVMIAIYVMTTIAAIATSGQGR